MPQVAYCTFEVLSSTVRKTVENITSQAKAKKLNIEDYTLYLNWGPPSKSWGCNPQWHYQDSRTKEKKKFKNAG